jgi:hypothetical protein
MHRQQVDDVGPVFASLVAVAEQLRGDRVTVGLVVDQDTAEGVAAEWVKHLEHSAELSVFRHDAQRIARRDWRPVERSCSLMHPMTR